jgi:hypothetical protein
MVASGANRHAEQNIARLLRLKFDYGLPILPLSAQDSFALMNCSVNMDTVPTLSATE